MTQLISCSNPTCKNLEIVTATQKIGLTGKSRVIANICFPGTGGTIAINCQEHLNGDFDTLLEAECELS